MSTLAANYIVTGNPTISQDYILSNFSDSNYIESTVRTPASGNYSILMKVRIGTLSGSNAVILTQSAPYMSTEILGYTISIHYFEEQPTTAYFALSTSNSIGHVDLPLANNTTYWIKLKVSSSDYADLLVIEDNSYTFDTLPEDSIWEFTDVSASSDVTYNARTFIGFYPSSSNSFTQVDLKTLKMYDPSSGMNFWNAVSEIPDEPTDDDTIDYTNYMIVGNPSYNDAGYYTNLSKNNCLIFPDAIKSNDYDVVLKFRAEPNQTEQVIVCCDKFMKITLSTSGGSSMYCYASCWHNGTETTKQIAANLTSSADYWIKRSYANGEYTYSWSRDGVTYATGVTFEDNGVEEGANENHFLVGTDASSGVCVLRNYVKDFKVYDRASGEVVWSPVTKVNLESNYTVVGSPTVSDEDVASNFSASNYLTFASPIIAGETSEIVFKINTGASIPSSDLPIFSFGNEKDIFLEGGSKKFCQWNGSTKRTGTTTAVVNTDYTIKLVYDGSYKLYVNDVLQFTTNDSIASNTTVYIGRHASQYWRGSIDLKNCYITKNGTEVWRALSKSIKYQGGSLIVSKGYYNSGTAEIKMPAQNITLPELSIGQPIGVKNTVIAASKNNSATAKLVGDSESLEGDWDVSVDLEHPVYLSNLKNYLLGDTPANVANASVTFQNAGTVQNCIVYGSPTISSSNIASNFSGSNYLEVKDATILSESSWEVGFSFNLTSISGYNFFFGSTNDISSSNAFLIGTNGSSLKVWLSSNGSSWNISDQGGSYTLALNTQYYCKLAFTGTSYKLSISTDGTTWTDAYNLTTSTKIASGKRIFMGATWDRSSGYMRGSIDLNNCYMIKEGQEVWRAVKTVPTTMTVATTGFLTKGSTPERTFWMPEAVTKELEGLKSSWNIGDRNNIFIYNDSFSDTADFTITYKDAPTGYMRPGDVVFSQNNPGTGSITLEPGLYEVTVVGGGGGSASDGSGGKGTYTQGTLTAVNDGQVVWGGQW